MTEKSSDTSIHLNLFTCKYKRKKRKDKKAHQLAPFPPAGEGGRLATKRGYSCFCLNSLPVPFQSAAGVERATSCEYGQPRTSRGPGGPGPRRCAIHGWMARRPGGGC